MNNRIIYLLVILLSLLSSGCRSKQQLIKTVPVRETTVVEMKSLEVPSDSITIRLPLEDLSNGKVTSGVSASLNGLQLVWKLRNGMVDIKAYKPPDVIYTPQKTITKEIPIEVVSEVEVNRLYWWQQLLIWIGVSCMLYIAMNIYKTINKRRTIWQRN